MRARAFSQPSPFLLFLHQDETVDVLERRIPNSGLDQGQLSRRAPLAVGRTAATRRRAGPADFPPLGGVLTIAGRAITLTDADAFTRRWLEDTLGTALGPALPTPVGDAEAAAAAAAEARARAARPRRARGPPDPTVLSFMSAWEERGVAGGGGGAASATTTTHAATLRFYVGDGTVEVVAAKPSAGGGGGATAAASTPAATATTTALTAAPGGGRVFLRRGLLPKPWPAGASPAARPAVTDAIGAPGGLLGALAASAAGVSAGGPLSPLQPASSTASTFVTPADLRVGATIDVHGRPFRLLACADGATKAWLVKVGGVEEAALAPLPPPPRPPLRARPAPPPHTPGCFGSEADSARSCGPRLVPRAPVRRAPSEADARAVLSFSAVLKSGSSTATPPTSSSSAAASTPHDAARRFTLCFYPADGALAVFEAPGDGFPGGRSLERAPVKRPACACVESRAPAGGRGGGACPACGGTSRAPAVSALSSALESGLPSPATHYVEGDLFVGATLRLHGRAFLLTGATEGTLRRLESGGGGGGGGGGATATAKGCASRAAAMAWSRGLLDGLPGGRGGAGGALRAALAGAILAGVGGAPPPARQQHRPGAQAPALPAPPPPPDAVSPAALAAALRAAVGPAAATPPVPHVWVALWRALAGGVGGGPVGEWLGAEAAVAGLTA